MIEGRVCLVTGASSGIGLETARGLARLGATVWMAGRDPERTRAATEEVRTTTGNDDVHFLLADFSSLAEVRSLGATLRERAEALHVLVHNAGLWHQKRRVSVDGIEDTLAVNHLAAFALTEELLPLLCASAPARVVTVSSRLHEGQRAFDFDDPQWERKRWRGLGAYSQSKLANVMFANELARREAANGITSNSLHPGDVATRVTRDSRVLSWLLDHVARPFVETPEQGARTSIHVASAPELEGVTGRYFKKRREHRPSPAALDSAACARLWALSEELVAGAGR